jgi:hypothetical protein
MVDVRHKRCLTPLCETIVDNKAYKRYCIWCFIHMFPNEKNARNYLTKQKSITNFIKTVFPMHNWVCDKIIQGGCSRRKPDILLDIGTHIIIVEIDENQHDEYDISCENKRIMQISQDLGHPHIVFIRFNPDS